MKQENAQRWAVTQVKTYRTDKLRWGVVLVSNQNVKYIPHQYGMRAAVRLRNRLEKETQKVSTVGGVKRNKGSV